MHGKAAPSSMVSKALPTGKSRLSNKGSETSQVTRNSPVGGMRHNLRMWF